MASASRPLHGELSPYLLQAASDPVLWYPFGEEAFARARELDRPVLLSIGYLACHYCHRMQKESFRDAEVARALNDHFVCIKVDREERPDVDGAYLAALSALTGGGGWPANLFLRPTGEPFFGCTYLPARTQAGRPGFLDLTRKIAELWKKERAELDRQSEELMRAACKPEPNASHFGLSADLRRTARHKLERAFDETFGGFGPGPKFPNPATLRFLLGEMERTPGTDPSGHRSAGEMALLTLDRMSEGALFDQIGGGFFRYATDDRWLTVHYEKMTADQAQLAALYLEAFRLTGRPAYRRIARETLEFLLAQLTAPSGAFFSSLGADSAQTDQGAPRNTPKGAKRPTPAAEVEGSFYLLSPEDVRAVVAEPAATHVCAFFGIVLEGPHQGRCLPSAQRPLAEVAREFGISEAELADSLDQGRLALRAAREARPHPELDDKITTSTNGLVITVLVRAALLLAAPEYLDAAARAARAVTNMHLSDDGSLCRYYRGQASPAKAVLEDYLELALGLLALFEATGEPTWRETALHLAAQAERRFAREGTPALLAGDPALFLPLSPAEDGALPAGNVVLLRLFARLAVHTQDSAWTERAIAIASSFARDVQRRPEHYADLLDASAVLFAPPLSIQVSGPEESAFALQSAASRKTAPSTVITRVSGSTAAGDAGSSTEAGVARAIVCGADACSPPCRTPEELAEQIETFRVQQRARARLVLGSRSEPGRATPEETQRFLDQKGVRAAARSQLGGLSVSRLGLGTRRVGLDAERHRQALTTAISQGMNLIDTSSAFAFGDSERLVGQVLAELFSRGVPRASLIVTTKVGVAFGALAEEIERRPAWAEASVPTSPGGTLKDGAFCWHEDFLGWQLARSQEQLGLDHLDVVLLQSPETLLAAGKTWEDSRILLRRAWTRLEAACKEGVVGNLGVFSATATKSPEARDFMPLLELLSLAEEVGGPDHHFSVAELPINLVERDALVASEAPGAIGLAAALRERGVYVWAARPLSALSGAGVTRLVDPPRPQQQEVDVPLPRARYKVASLEAEFETTFGARLRLAGVKQQGPLLPLSGLLGKTLERIESLQQFHLAESTMVTPKLRGLLGQLDRAFTQNGGGDWPRFRDKYTRAVGDYLAAIRQVATENNRRLLANLRKEIPKEPAFSVLPILAHPPARFAQFAMGVLMEHPDVDATLVGLRTPEQAREATALLHDEPIGSTPTG